MVQPLLSSSRPLVIIACCNSLTISKLSNTDFVLENPDTAPVGITPVCGIPRAANSSLGNIAVRPYYILLAPHISLHSLSERHRLWSFCRLRPLSHPPLQQAQSCSGPHRAPRDIDNLYYDVHPPTLNDWLDLRPGFRCPHHHHSDPCRRRCVFLLVSARERAHCNAGGSASSLKK